jgi:hypothetical protein
MMLTQPEAQRTGPPLDRTPCPRLPLVRLYRSSGAVPEKPANTCEWMMPRLAAARRPLGYEASAIRL